MSFLSLLLMKYRAGRTLRRMERLVNEYRSCAERGDKHMAPLIHEEIIMLDRHLTKLLSWWEAEVRRRRAVRS